MQPSKSALFRAERNEKSLARLNRALPAVFPAPVLIHALARPFIPPMPRLAVDSYWRSHPIRADRLARALARRSGAPEGWRWALAARSESGVASSFRIPPAPFREKAFSLGPGHCCICGQPVYRVGWHEDMWGAGPSRTACWHSACVTAWRLWIQPRDFVKPLRRLQGRACARSGDRLWKTAEIDHRVPLFAVWREHRERPWPDLLDYWGLPNLQIINRDSHAEKCADEAALRAVLRVAARQAIEA